VASRTYGCIAAVLGAIALAVFAAGCGSSSGNAAAAAATTGTTTTTQTATTAGGFGGGRGSNASGGQQNPAFAKYTACLKSHGVTFGSTSSSSPAFTKATAACKSLLPSAAGGSVNGGTTSP
jgi:hypothetical protein